jgi:hypothetical protein
MGNVRYQEVDGEILTIHQLVIYSFTEVEFLNEAGLNCIDWDQSPAGKFISEHAIKKIWHKRHNPMKCEYSVVLGIEIEEKKLVEYYLKFDKM